MELSENINPAIPLLSEGFLAHFIPTLTQVEEQLRELERRQKLLLEEMKTTNTRMENQDNYEYIALSFSKIPQYHEKLQYIRNTMISMLSRSKNLNQRVSQLKIMKEQQLAQIAEIQKRERNFDQTVLAAKIVENNPPPSVPKAVVVSTKISKKKKKDKTKDKGKGKEKVVRREIEFSSSSTTSVVESKIEVTKDTSFEKTEG
ncbi:unnamed protein product [Rhizophagus irregularis]|uniref:Biogenesis of lysosome-related organelles complex 1 subunit 6 n=4 Tax=Rhizophagus irregularis TaxID=588596 RepID=A0A2I1EKY3_9GLOM|nr:hypothetical protein GLOIN_2v1647962 [Rhizophagus irregularis DAOM 181602=DAOM 197198]EXX72890.1 hypothetical protein RirG_065000 [Rhizophagus irregularis DAOM 197198w]PKC72709.1 hypothetical protein RhiirA1_490613 [Rhizophagus irregularis]RGB39299.1 Snapin/Pallidin-domain-containing protein [Rhizophagus diaphanus] [Rhizophagus sp. MUCL 43196]PKK80721.1 hypothetical protein RhiirC2_859624 [Rhizophagus irregularis]PKY22779.1 hypothetical protein RhiirB3_526030 [Rhizophagus irregularis]|eukprot:XP_025174315.1 hypothetical protein GLOIN_2v1647962 [Rhizophagus irregularis DAOM 181602=DAOM 197198]